MGSTFYSLHYHIVFSTKDRRPLIRADWQPALHEYLGGTARGLGAVAESVGGVRDHVHLLVSMNTTHVLADFVRELKKAASVWAAEKHDRFFGWQEGYAVFSVSWTHNGAVWRYITNQEKHHYRVPFTEELRKLERNGVAYDPKWLE